MDDFLRNEQELAMFFTEKKDPLQKVKQVKFAPFKKTELSGKPRSLNKLRDLKLVITAELGKTTLTVRQLLGLKAGDTLELDKLAGEMTDIYMNKQKLAMGEVLVINEVFGVRLNFITSIKEQQKKEEL